MRKQVSDWIDETMAVKLVVFLARCKRTYRPLVICVDGTTLSLFMRTEIASTFERSFFYEFYEALLLFEFYEALLLFDIY